MTHRELADLLPWYVNATLDERERRAVEEHLASCADCAREAAQMRELHAALLEEDAPSPSPSALVRAHAAIDRPPHWWTGLSFVVRVALAAQLLLIAGLAALLLARSPARPPGPGFHTAGGPESPRGAAPRATIVLAFTEGASEAALRQTIAGIGGRIVDGPSAAGSYTVELPLAEDRDGEIEAVLRRLREDRAHVRLAARRY